MTSVDVERVLADAFRAESIQNPRALGDALAPSQKIERAAKAVADSVQEAFKICSSIVVDRFYISGSFGKKTALPDFVIDLVLFLNDASPPFESELEIFREYLPMNLTGITILQSSPSSITFPHEWFQDRSPPSTKSSEGPFSESVYGPRSN